MLRAIAYLVVMVVLGGPALAQTVDCVFAKEPAKAGHFGTLSLQYYGTRWEMQVATPDGAVTLDGKLAIDGSPWEAEIAGGLDDTVVTISDLPGTLDLTEDLLEKMQGGHRLTITGTAKGEKVSASYPLIGSRKAIETIRNGCPG
jgi:hypothetical protein